MKHGRKVNGISAEARAALESYEFPGNVRELANTIERAVIVSTSERIEAKDLPDSLHAAATLRRRRARRQTLAELEADYIRDTLSATKGNKSEAARLLGISRKNLYEKLARYEKGLKDEG